MKRKPATIELIDHPWAKPRTLYKSDGTPYQFPIFYYPCVIDGRRHNATSSSRSRLSFILTNACIQDRMIEYSNPFPHKHTRAKFERPTP